MFDSFIAVASDVRWELDEVLASDDRVIALRGAIRGTHNDGGGPFEIAYGLVATVENGRRVREDVYEPGDRQAMIARFAEVGGGQGPLGDRPPERVWAEVRRRLAAGDIDGLVDRYAANYELTDHRPLGWGVLRKDDLRPLLQSTFATGSGWWFRVDEVLACDDQALAMLFTICGTDSGAGGGAAEIAFGGVFLIQDGAITQVDQYEPDDRQAMLARYAELSGGRDVLGDRPPERLVAEFSRCFAARDIDGLIDLYADDHLMVDHRSLGWESEADKQGTRRLAESMFAAGSGMRFEVDEVLACDDRVIAFTVAICGTNNDGGGPFEMAYGVVALVEDGLLSRVDQYEHADRQAMLVRFAELGGGLGLMRNRPPERWLAEFAVRWPMCDVDRQLELIRADWVLIDHRALGWEELNKESLRPFWESFFAAGSDWRFEVDEVLGCDDRVVAFRCSYHGTNNDGGGRFEIATGAVAVIDGGVMARLEQFEPDDRPAILARYAELSAQRGVLGSRLPEQHVAELIRRVHAREFDRLAELYAADSVSVDHRAVGWAEYRQGDVRAMYESSVRAAPDGRWDIGEVLACDDRVIAFTAALRGTNPDGGGAFEIPLGVVAVIEDGLRRREDIYEPEDRQAMLVRFAELGGGLGLLGDRPPERVWAELCRRVAAHDIDGVVDMYAANYALIDHRTLGWTEVRKDDVRPFYESMFAAGSDWWFRVDEVLACDDQVLAVSFTTRGTNDVGGGPAEIAVGTVLVIQDGSIIRGDQYEHDDRQAMLARFAELGGDPG